MGAKRLIFLRPVLGFNGIVPWRRDRHLRRSTSDLRRDNTCVRFPRKVPKQHLFVLVLPERLVRFHSDVGFFYVAGLGMVDGPGWEILPSLAAFVVTQTSILVLVYLVHFRLVDR